MSTLKVNKLRDTAGSADAITLDPNGGAVLAGVTTVTSVKVGAAVTISESGIEASGIGITCANINGTQIGGRRNLIINGAMNIAQRATSSTSTGYQTVDRMRHYHSGTDEAPTYAQVDVSSGTTPYTEGFRKAFKFTNGNQTSGAGASDAIEVVYRSEAQDIANSGWNYTSASSFITLSFWIKSSVAQNFYGHMTTADGTAQNYPFETGSLTADTWTKIVKTIPGNSNLQFDNDEGKAFDLKWVAFRGTSYTGSGSALNTWATYASGSRMPDNTSTWYTTNDATLEITGLQLEVGSQATPFEHLSKAEELTLCERYCEVILEGESDGAYMVNSVAYTTNQLYAIFRFKVEKRVSPTLEHTTGTNYYINYRDNGGINFDSFSGLSWPSKRATGIYQSSTSFGAGQAGLLGSNNSNALVYLTAEL